MICSKKTLLETISGLTLNLSSGWIGAVVVSPSIINFNLSIEYLEILFLNLIFGTFGIVFTLFLTERTKLYEF